MSVLGQAPIINWSYYWSLYTQVYKSNSYTHRWMGNRTRSCYSNPLMQYHSGILTIAFTAAAPLGDCRTCAGCHPSSGKMLLFGDLTLVSLFSTFHTYSGLFKSIACLLTQMHQFSYSWDTNINARKFLFHSPLRWIIYALKSFLVLVSLIWYDAAGYLPLCPQMNLEQLKQNWLFFFGCIQQ